MMVIITSRHYNINIPCILIVRCALGLVDVHWTVMSSDTLEITSSDVVSPDIVIIHRWVQQLCPINKPLY